MGEEQQTSSDQESSQRIDNEILPGWENWPGWGDEGAPIQWRKVTAEKWRKVLAKHPISHAYVEANRSYDDESMTDVEQAIIFRQESLEELDPEDEDYEERKVELLGEIEACRNTLEDVESGRASDLNYKPDPNRPVLQIL